MAVKRHIHWKMKKDWAKFKNYNPERATKDGWFVFKCAYSMGFKHGRKVQKRIGGE